MKLRDIPLYRFNAPKEVFYDHVSNPANQGFCTPSDNCLPTGLLNVESCRDGMYSAAASRSCFRWQLCFVYIDVFRSIYLSYTKDVKLRGIPLYRFNAPKEVFYSVKKNPANKGFCVPTENCLASGLLNVESCRDGMYHNTV